MKLFKKRVCKRCFSVGGVYRESPKKVKSGRIVYYPMGICILCYREYQREWMFSKRSDPKKLKIIRETARKYYANNKEKHAEWSKNFRNKNRDRLSEEAKERYQMKKIKKGKNS